MTSIAPLLPAPVAPPAPAAPAGIPALPTPEFDYIFDFPDVAAGDRFKIVSGSSAKGFPIRGSAVVEELDPNSARVWLKAGRFGFNKEITLDIDQTGPADVRVQMQLKGGKPSVSNGSVTAVRTNYSEFQGGPDGALKGAAILQQNAKGQLVLEAHGVRDVLDGGDLVLVLERERTA